MPSFKGLLSQKYRGKTDYITIAIAVLLSLIGILMVYSASYYSAEITYDDKFFYMKKQVLGAVLGILAMFGMSRLNYHILEKLKWPAIIISLVLLGLVFIPGIGVDKLGAKRWIDLPGFTIQPSEIAKFGLIIFISGYMSKYPGRMRKFTGLLPVLGAGGVTAVLIILEPNMSITICVILLMLVLMFVGGARIKHFLILAVPIAALIPILIILEPYRMKRLMAFINPWESPLAEGFQLIQSFYSIGSGGLFGVGLFNSRQAKLFLPFAESDFIFSIICEETGFVGAVVLTALFLILIIRLVRIAMRAPDRLGCYLASGVAAIIAIQVAINIAVVTGSIPPTGLPLPFISAGSTSLVVFLAAIGIALNVGKAEHRGHIT